MGNNSCECNDCYTNKNQTEQNLSHEYIGRQKTLSKNNISFILQNNYILGISSTNNYPSTTKFKSLYKNNSPSNLSSTRYNVSNKNISQINNEKDFIKLNDDINQKNEETNYKLNDKSIENNININNINNIDNNLKYDINLFKNNENKNRRKNDVFKNILLSQSTKRLNESDLNSVIRKSTIREYK